MSGQAFRRSAPLGLLAGILISTTACDNVAWGGLRMHLMPPPDATVGVQADTAGGKESGGLNLPKGPVLYAATRDSSGVSVVPVGEIAGDSLRPFRDEKDAPGYRAAFARELMAPGSRITLFAAGARVGTFTIGDVGTDETYCTPRPKATGVLELVPEAAQATTFLGIPEKFTDSTAWQPYKPVEDDRVQRAAGIDLAAAEIPKLGATWPTSMATARVSLQALHIASGAPAVSNTFIFRDQNAIQPAEPRSYSLYLLAIADSVPKAGETLLEASYKPAYTWYRVAGSDGKGIPRYFQHMDWDHDGKTEILLDVIGERHRWNAVIAQKGNQWTRTFEDPCGAAAPKIEDRDTAAAANRVTPTVPSP